MAVSYKDIDELTQKAAVDGNEKLPVSDTEYITPSQMYYPGNSNKSDVAWACSTLDVAGQVKIYNQSGAGLIIKRNTSSGNASISMFPDNQEQYGWYIEAGRNAASKNFIIESVTNGTPSQVFTITPAGNVSASGTITPGSDSRIKKNQKEISNDEGIRVLQNLTPKTWEFNSRSDDNSDGQFGAGLIAQEVKDVVPGAVTISEMAGFKDFHSLNYNTIQGYEIAAIKGLMEEVRELRAEIEELKKR